MKEKLIFEKSVSGRKAYDLGEDTLPAKDRSELIPKDMLREELSELPEVSELDLVRHYTNLSRINMGVDSSFYPLGSCTMKYNPKFTEKVSRLTGFTDMHPHVPEELAQGTLSILYETERLLCEICGVAEFSLHPAAGAHGELTGMLIARAYFNSKKESRKKILIPDSAHGTNPASAALVGYDVETVPSNSSGMVDVAVLEKMIDENTACLMMTNPNTLGLFEKDVLQIAKLAHEKGVLLYYDGANLNALAGKCRPGDMGFDIIHLNLHKTFATPHGGGGPGSGPVGVCERLRKFLPVPKIQKGPDGTLFWFENEVSSIGRVKAFYGNIGVIIKAYAYIKALGQAGLERVSENAVLNANYILSKIKSVFDIPYGEKCMHEFVASASVQKNRGVRALDIAKALLERGFHAPTIYFPLIVQEALMIEPTETESKETLDEFIKALVEINADIDNNKDKLLNAPRNLPVCRPDEVLAARKPVLRWKKRA